MLGPARKSPERVRALDRVQGWTRERFELPADTAIHVWELACILPGCPPVETAVVFWIAERQHRFKVFKPLEEVVRDDLPPAWFREALVAPDGFECDCC